jgi:hypothetical protein
LVAAAQLGRRYVGYDMDEAYCALAKRRVADALGAAPAAGVPTPPARDGKSAPKLAEEVLLAAGFIIRHRNRRVPGSGVTVSFVAEDALGATWFFDVAGAGTSHRGGLLRTETVCRTLGKAGALRGWNDQQAAPVPFVLLTSHLPHRSTEGDVVLRAAGPLAFFDAVELLSEEGRLRLAQYAGGGQAGQPQPGFWTAADLARRRR